MTPQRPSSAASSEPDPGSGAPSAEMLAEITAFLAERDLYGLLWCDEDLAATHRYGKLADFVPLSQSICDSLLPLMGFEEQIKALRRQPDRTIEIPNVSIRQSGVPSPRLNINVYWIPVRRYYLVALSRVLRRSDLELELNHQIRAKRIAEREVAEKSRALARANRDLERVNDDLEEFAYVISHDLKAPMRAIKFLSGDLTQSLAAGDQAAANDQLAQIEQQTRRMSAMLMGLFEYASLDRKQEGLEDVDTGALIAEIAQSLQASRPGTTVTAATGGPVINTLAAPLDQVLRNLIENAIKHHDRDDGSVTVSIEDNEGHLTFVVADDGPGIPADYGDAVFHPFQKVDNNRNLDSSGVGLSIVKKTVETAGGAIELHSDVAAGRGTVFRVTWPKLMIA